MFQPKFAMLSFYRVSPSVSVCLQRAFFKIYHAKSKTINFVLKEKEQTLKWQYQQQQQQQQQQNQATWEKIQQIIITEQSQEFGNLNKNQSNQMVKIN